MAQTLTTMGDSASVARLLIEDILGMVKPEEYRFLEEICTKLYGLRIANTESYKHNIKGIMARKQFTFTVGLSDATKTYQLLHVVGHYHFMTSALRKGVRRYDYIFDTFQNASLLVYEEPEERVVCLDLPHESEIYEIPPGIRANRIAFEAGANRYAGLILDYLNMSHLSGLMNAYEPADIRYLLDITTMGRPAIVKDDIQYIERYVCPDLKLEDAPDHEGVFDPISFRIGDIDWSYLEKLKLEFHFF